MRVGEIEVTALLDGAMGGGGEPFIPRFFPVGLSVISCGGGRLSIRPSLG